MLVLFVPLAFAAEGDQSSLDKDGDGKVSKQEFLDAASTTFDMLDKNKDIVLKRNEIKQMGGIDVQKFMWEIDGNNDGKILKKEFEQAAAKRFSTLDKNNDGCISRKEWLDGRNKKDPMLILFKF